MVFNEKESSLTLSGPFLPTMETYSKIDKRDFIILGELADKRKVTLVAYYMHNKQETLGQQYVYSKTEFQIKFIILGTHVRKLDDIEFDIVLVEYSNLAKWFKFELDDKFLSVTIDKQPTYSTRYRKPIELSVESTCSVQIFSSEKVTFEEFTNEHTSSENVYVKFYAIKNNHLMDCLELMGVFRDFLNFIIVEDIQTKSFKAIVKTESHYEKEKVEVLWKSPISSKLEKSPTGNICFFQFHEVKEQFNQIINSWFKFKTELIVVYELYFGVMYNSEQYLTNKFLMTSEAIEVYYDQKFKNSDITKSLKELYDKIMPHIKNIPLSNYITSEDIETVNSWMGNGKRPSLRSRIEDLYATYSEIIPYLSIKIGSKECFAHKVSYYRNGLTHGDISSEEIDDADLFWTYMDLRLLLRLCILSQLGFSNDKISVFCHTEAPYSLKEIMIDKKRTTLEFFDPNTETAYAWSEKLTNRCDLPKSIRGNHNLLLKIVDSVQVCVENERDLDINEKKMKENVVTESEKSDLPNIDLANLGNEKKEKFFERIHAANKQYLQNLQKRDDIVGVSLALWSGCLSAVKILSREENGGPKQEIRGRVFQMIEKISSERPVFGFGVELALLWKINHDQSDDVQIEEGAIDSRIKKYEKLYNDKTSKKNKLL